MSFCAPYSRASKRGVAAASKNIPVAVIDFAAILK
jgi:hypothetical protein